MSPPKHELCAYVARFHQRAEGDFKDKWAALRSFTARRADVIIEPKIDATRVFVFSNDKTVKLASKSLRDEKHNGVYTVADYPDFFKGLVAGVTIKPFSILDGEFFRGFGDNPHPIPQLYVWDVLLSNREDVRGKPPAERRRILTETLRENNLIRLVPTQVVHIAGEPVQTVVDQIHDLFDSYVGQGFEGVMVKDPLAPYSTSATDWLKVKKTIEDLNLSGLDVVVKRVHDSEKYLQDGIARAWEVITYDDEGREVDNGSVSSAMTGVDSRLIQPGTVLEVTCQEVFPSLHMRHPTIRKIRTDKNPRDCSVHQFLRASGQEQVVAVQR
jgi:ATP-dependent DNA ligase